MLGERLFRVLRAEIGTQRYRGSAGGGLLLAALLAGCAVDPPDYGVPPGTGEETPPEQTTNSEQPNRSNWNTPDAGDTPEVDAGSTPVLQEPVGGCTDGATRTCGPPNVVGNCKLGMRTCHEGVWGECEGAVMPEARDCSSPLDNDCDGLPDNTVDDACRCVVDMKEPCDTHPGFDGRGPCVAGERACVLSLDKQTSDWGECTGAVGPVPDDDCTFKGDDSNCNGRPNDTCTCVEGEAVDCGPPSAVGICKLGKMTCVNGKYGDCIGAVYAKARDCTSATDNDCDGKPDNSIDSVCTCAVGATQACGEHPGLDDIGICKAGTQTCVAGAGNKTSAFNTCTGSVGPATRNCTSTADNDCNGVADNALDTVCACTIGGPPTPCGTHPEDGKGICHAGQAVCVPGPNNASATLGACTGSVGPLAADSCTVAGDDSNCNGVANDSCECVVSTSCADPGKARCSAGKCVACTSSTDCAHIPGLAVCSAGQCVECTAASAAACAATEVCDASTNTCVAAPPPPPPPPPPPAETP